MTEIKLQIVKEQVLELNASKSIMYLIHQRTTDLKTAVILLSIPFTSWSAPQLCLNLPINGSYHWSITNNKPIQEETFFFFKLSMYFIKSAKIKSAEILLAKLNMPFSRK